ncbi:hypothetical protein BJV74DRAFT_61342 [Russula compacta]|nr:hypothetical protein BJV74DRAFT_61342 [Russula compacta]
MLTQHNTTQSFGNSPITSCVSDYTFGPSPPQILARDNSFLQWILNKKRCAFDTTYAIPPAVMIHLLLDESPPRQLSGWGLIRTFTTLPSASSLSVAGHHCCAFHWHICRKARSFRLSMMVIYSGDCMLINGYLHPLEHFPPAVLRRLNWQSRGLHWNFDPSLPTCRYNRNSLILDVCLVAVPV